MKIIIKLSDKELVLLSRTITGSGGWQSLLRKLRQNIRGNNLVLSNKDIGKIIKYTLDYGQGGYEDRLLPIVKKIIELANVILAALNYKPIDI